MAIRSASQGSVAAVIFDCDGTLVDTETLYFHSFNRVIAQLRGDAPGMPPALDGEVWGRDCSGRGLEKDARYGVENFDCKGASAETFLENWKRDFAESIAEFGSIVLLEGFDDIYSEARRRGLKIGVASSSDGEGLRQKLRNGVVAHSKVVSGLDAFDVIVSNDDVTRHKPDPEIYLLAAQRLGVRPEDCLVVEDTSTGVQAGRSAGMRVAAVPNLYTHGHDFSQADAVVATLRDAISLL